MQAGSSPANAVLAEQYLGTLEDTPTVAEFKAMLPMSAIMPEPNGGEKCTRLSASLPTHRINPGTIQSGDPMLYGNHTLVLFYRTFKTSYTYTLGPGRRPLSAGRRGWFWPHPGNS
jgi:hypothetical protein